MRLEDLNNMEQGQLKEMLSQCCGSKAWVNKMVANFPVNDKNTLIRIADKAWFTCKEED